MSILRAQGKIVSPHSRDIAPGRPVMKFALRTMDHEGTTTMYPCVAWGEVAAKMGKFDEGDMVDIIARTVTRTFPGQKPTTEYVVSEYKLLKHKP